MKNTSASGLIIALVIFFGIFTFYILCIKTDNYSLVDNPTELPIELTINNKDYYIAPNQSAKIPLKKGLNSIFLSSVDSVLIDSTFELKTRNTLINPTFSTYFIASQYYGIRRDQDSIFSNVKSDIDGKEYIGKILKTNDLIISDFDYNLLDNFPKLMSESKLSVFKKVLLW